MRIFVSKIYICNGGNEKKKFFFSFCNTESPLARLNQNVEFFPTINWLELYLMPRWVLKPILKYCVISLFKFSPKKKIRY